MIGNLGLLSNLDTISLRAHPEVDGYHDDERGRYVLQRPPEAYNRLRRWREFTRETAREDFRHLSAKDSIQDQLLYTAQFSTYPDVVDSPALILRALAGVSQHCPTRQVQLVIESPLNVLGEQ